MLLRKLITDLNVTHLRENNDSPEFVISSFSPIPQMVKNIYSLMYGACCRRFRPVKCKLPKGSWEIWTVPEIQLCFALAFYATFEPTPTLQPLCPKSYLRRGIKKAQTRCRYSFCLAASLCSLPAALPVPAPLGKACCKLLTLISQCGSLKRSIWLQWN